ncbi:MAG: biotin/lipoyl-containing protein [Parvularculaceae bacterium]
MAQFTAAAVRHGEGLRIFIGANAVDIDFLTRFRARWPPLRRRLADGADAGRHHAPKAAPGDSVEAGATLLVMEAMKMEHAIKAPHDGVIKSFRFRSGRSGEGRRSARGIRGKRVEVSDEAIHPPRCRQAGIGSDPTSEAIPPGSDQSRMDGERKDCEAHGAEHEWHNLDGVSSGCYHCEVIRKGQLWMQQTI